MSCDILEECTDNKDKDIFLTMNANGYAWLDIWDDKGNISFELSPDKKGIDNAEKIINALNAWIEKVK